MYATFATTERKKFGDAILVDVRKRIEQLSKIASNDHRARHALRKNRQARQGFDAFAPTKFERIGAQREQSDREIVRNSKFTQILEQLIVSHRGDFVLLHHFSKRAVE